MADILGVNINNIFVVESITKPYAASTVHRVKKATQCIFAMAKRQRLVDFNYASAEYVSHGRKPKRNIKCLDDKQAKQFYEILTECEDIRIKTAFIILLFTGLRRGELAGFEWKDINFENKTISICRTENHSRSMGFYTKTPKTEGSIRIISISETVKNQLLDYREWYLFQRICWGDKWVESDRVFIRENGGKADPQCFDRWLKILRSKYNLPHFTVHSLRHTNITIQIAAGVPLTTVSGRAGHSRTSTTTTDIYSHFIKTSDQQAAETLDNIFGNKEGD